MIAVTCSSCRLRFEAPAAERRIHGADIVCPACDAGEPIVLDLAGRGGPAEAAKTVVGAEEAARDATAGAERTLEETDIVAPPTEHLQAEHLQAEHLQAERLPTERLRVTPPPLDPTEPEQAVEPERAVELATLDPAIPDPVSPVYVDFDTATPPPRSGGAAAFALAAAVAGLSVIAVSAAWQSERSVVGSVRHVLTSFAPGTDVPGAGSPPAAGAGFGKTDERFVTAAVAPASNARSNARLNIQSNIQSKLRIAHVATELAMTDAGRELRVSAHVSNEGAMSARAPALRVSIRSADGTVLHRWGDTPAGGIDARETRAFTLTTTRIPDGASDVKVDFAQTFPAKIYPAKPHPAQP